MNDLFPGEIILVALFIAVAFIYTAICVLKNEKNAHEGARKERGKKMNILAIRKKEREANLAYLEQLRHENRELKKKVNYYKGVVKEQEEKIKILDNSYYDLLIGRSASIFTQRKDETA